MKKSYKSLLRPFTTLSPHSVAILYGSIASGKARPDSDIDIALITTSRADRQKAEAIADQIGIQHGKTVSIAKFTPQQFRQPANAGFAREVKKGILIHGTRSQLEGNN